MTLADVRNSVPLTRFRRFRHTRPFWGGVLVLVAGLEIGSLPFGPTDALIRAGASAVAGLACAVLLVALGLLILAVPSQRFVAGFAAVVVSLAAFVFSNLGGFVVGMLLGIVGGSLAFGWIPDARPVAVAPESGRGNGDELG